MARLTDIMNFYTLVAGLFTRERVVAGWLFIGFVFAFTHSVACMVGRGCWEVRRMLGIRKRGFYSKCFIR
jgi:hypothetical protein